jgi:glucose/arabinose dehydrogenase
MKFSGGALSLFLDVSAEVPVNPEDERGLLALAFAPDYATSGKFYIALTATTGTDTNADFIWEYDNDNVTPRKLIFRADPSDAAHNGGTLVFGPDGFLYAGLGDGGGTCATNRGDAAQDINSYFGKIMRLDPKGSHPKYAAAGNPFSGMGTGDDSYADTVWHYGFRNPFRFSFDPANGDLYIGDVGQSDYEEVDFVPAGGSGLNFGWPHYEGVQLASATCGVSWPMRPGTTQTAPMVAIDRGDHVPNTPRTPNFDDYVAMMGGIVYRGTAIPALQGAYFFGDYFGQRMGALYRCNGQTSPVTPVNKDCSLVIGNEACFDAKSGPELATLTAILRGNDGEMYFIGNRDTLYKVVPN